MKSLTVFAFVLVAGCAGAQHAAPEPALSSSVESEKRVSAERDKQIGSLKQRQATRAREEREQKAEAREQEEQRREADRKAANKEISDRHFDDFRNDPSGYMREHAAVISAFEAMATNCEINYRVYGRLDAIKKRECIRMFEMIQEPEQISPINMIVSVAQALRDSNAMSYDQKVTVREAERGMKAFRTLSLY